MPGHACDMGLACLLSCVAKHIEINRKASTKQAWPMSILRPLPALLLMYAFKQNSAHSPRKLLSNPTLALSHQDDEQGGNTGTSDRNGTTTGLPAYLLTCLEKLDSHACIIETCRQGKSSNHDKDGPLTHFTTKPNGLIPCHFEVNFLPSCAT